MSLIGFYTSECTLQVVRFVAGSLDLGYLYDESGPASRSASRRTRWVARTGNSMSDSAIILEQVEDTSEELRVPVDQGTQTEVSEGPEQVEIGVQTESLARSFSTIRKDLPQFSRPAKHSVK